MKKILNVLQIGRNTENRTFLAAKAPFRGLGVSLSATSLQCAIVFNFFIINF